MPSPTKRILSEKVLASQQLCFLWGDAPCKSKKRQRKDRNQEPSDQRKIEIQVTALQGAQTLRAPFDDMRGGLKEMPSNRSVRSCEKNQPLDEVLANLVLALRAHRRLIN